MFWSGNYIVVRELNFLLKEENVTLSQVLEADDILQECKADNKALMQFLTRPDILAELITLITEEPPQNVELAQQYRHASIACEVLTSPLSMLSDRLSQDTAQMNRLCDFINRDPPLNPLLASYFSKTVEMLLERSPKQDWYLYHIVCLRVLDFFKSRRDFLPNLLRHISTSAIADTFKYFIRLDDLFNKIIMEWLEEHQFIENLILIICGTYLPEPLPPAAEDREKGTREPSEKGAARAAGDLLGPGEEGSQDHQNNSTGPVEAAGGGGARRARAAAVASANAAALLCDLVATGCATEGATARSRTALALGGWVGSAAGVRALLAGVFTSGAHARSAALLNGCRLLRALLENHQALGAEGTGSRSGVELAVAPHLPLLHQALLHHPQAAGQTEGTPARDDSTCVGAARIQTAALLAHLAASSVSEVTSTMLTLGTPGVLVDMFFRFPSNNFLHAQVHVFCRNALQNAAYRTQYARHLLVECDLLTRLMDAYEENENKQSESPRSGYMGHATLMLGCIAEVLAQEELELPPALLQRWPAFRSVRLQPALHHLDTPLGGSYPSENTYEVDNITDALAANYDFSYAMATVTMDEAGDDIANDNEMCHPGGHADSAEFIADGLGIDDDDAKMNTAKSNFLELASQRFDDDMWDEGPDDSGGAGVQDVLNAVSPWETVGASNNGCGSSGASGTEEWAQFEGDAFPVYPAPTDLARWPGDMYGGHAHSGSGSDTIEAGLRELVFDEKVLDDTVSLANNLLTAMSAMSPQAIANLVNANLAPLPLPHTDSDHSTESADTVVQSADTVVQSADTVVQSADTVVQSADTVVQSADTDVQSADAPVRSADTPVQSTDTPVQSTDAPVQSTDAPAERTDLPEVSPSDGEVKLTQNVPNSNSPLKLSPPNSPLNVNSLESNIESRPESKDCDRTEPTKVNDISPVETQTSVSDSMKTSTQDTSLESTNRVIVIPETPVEVSETTLEVSETPEVADASER